MDDQFCECFITRFVHQSATYCKIGLQAHSLTDLTAVANSTTRDVNFQRFMTVDDCLQRALIKKKYWR